ncbi:MAG: hypothetical protein [Cressdnaviricota sp.]|nr:MAG: hypothetical protein [Cressdnaviricota sp.]
MDSNKYALYKILDEHKSKGSKFYDKMVELLDKQGFEGFMSALSKREAILKVPELQLAFPYPYTTAVAPGLNAFVYTVVTHLTVPWSFTLTNVFSAPVDTHRYYLSLDQFPYVSNGEMSILRTGTVLPGANVGFYRDGTLGYNRDSEAMTTIPLASPIFVDTDVISVRELIPGQIEFGVNGVYTLFNFGEVWVTQPLNTRSFHQCVYTPAVASTVTRTLT